MNRIYERVESPEPEIGMGATKLLYSDRVPFTIIEIPKKDVILIQQDKAIRTDKNGLSESQTYEFKTDPEGLILKVTKKRGRWISDGSVILLGIRMSYRDPHF